MVMKNFDPTRGVTPCKLMVLLHFYYSPEPYPLDSPAVEDAIQYWLHLAMITEHDFGNDEDDTFVTTEKGNAYINAITKIPFPVQTWTVPLVDNQPEQQEVPSAKRHTS